MSNLSQFKRQLLIIRKVQRNNQKNVFPSLEDLRNYLEKEEIEVSEITLKRDVRDIRSDFGIDLEYSKKERGYYINSDIENDSVLQGALEFFEILTSLNRDGGMPDFVLPEKRKAKGTEHFYHLMKAIENKEKVSFTYTKYDSEQQTNPIVSPHFIKESRGRWYLIANEENKTDFKSYALDRMSDVFTTREKYRKRLPKKLIEEKYKDCFAMFTSEKKPENVILSFDKRDGNYINSYPIHHSQKTEIKKDKVFVYLKIKITLDFIMELMSRAWSVEVIEPVSLRETLHNYFKEATKRNK
jgi:proteasome accessory factor B